MYSSIAEAVWDHSTKTPEKMAAADAQGSYTYSQLCAAAKRLAFCLSQIPVREGEFVLAECTQDIGFLAVDLACELLGAVFVPVEKKAVEDRVREIYQQTKAVCIIGKTDYSGVGKFCGADWLLQEAADGPEYEGDMPKRETLAEVLFTTGTTGQPKGIMLSHGANVAVAENIQQGTAMEEKSVELIPLPLSHSHGLRTCYAHLLHGSSVVIMDGVLNIGLLFRLMEQYQVNALDFSPTLAKLLLKAARRGLAKQQERIAYIEIGTAVLEEELKGRLKEMFPAARLYNFYGSTEAGRSCVLDFNREDYPSCIGYPSKNARFFITDEERRVIKSSREEPGLVAVSGRMMMTGYFGSEELTRATLVDGVLYSSDLGYIDEAGRVYVLGRADDIINYKGIKIAPEEIETVARTYPGVLDCCCVPMADKVCGQIPKLYVETAAGEDFSVEGCLEFLKQRLEPSRVPGRVELTGKIPRAGNGKLQRKKLMQEV